MNITLRKKALKGDKESLFLDYTLSQGPKKRIKEYLKIYLYTLPKTNAEKEHNKKSLLLAESIRSKRLLELQHDQHNFSHLIKEKKEELNFIEYFKIQSERLKSNESEYWIWISTLRQLKVFKGDYIPITDIDREWLEDYKHFLQHKALTICNKKYSPNTARYYLNKVKLCLKQAVKDKIIKYNPSIEVQGIKTIESNREFLTLDELKTLFKTDFEFPDIKNAFIFSALTGLRWSDLSKLTWYEVQHSTEQGWFLRFRQKKTKGLETLPISAQARELLGEAGSPDQKVFNHLPMYGTWVNYRLRQWIPKAGITKKITFHCARHTYATLQLTLGTDIYTVSKMLGHKNLKTTQVYANIIDKKKVDAANIIPNLND